MGAVGSPLQRGTHEVLSSPQSAPVSQRAGSSSQPSGPWPHTSPSCSLSGRSHTGGWRREWGHRLDLTRSQRSRAQLDVLMTPVQIFRAKRKHASCEGVVGILTFQSIKMMIPSRRIPATAAEMIIHNGSSWMGSTASTGTTSTVNYSTEHTVL